MNLGAFEQFMRVVVPFPVGLDDLQKVEIRPRHVGERKEPMELRFYFYQRGLDGEKFVDSRGEAATHLFICTLDNLLNYG